MGSPQLSSVDVPMLLDQPLDRVISYPINLGGEPLEVTCLSMGNPQSVIFVPELDEIELEELGPLIEHHPVFPDRTNVEFAEVLDRSRLRIRIWERGAGHTMSSGTGSCAAAVAGALNLLTDRVVTVHTEGGDFRVDWREDGNVKLTGPAEVVYQGRWLRA